MTFLKTFECIGIVQMCLVIRNEIIYWINAQLPYYHNCGTKES